MVEKHRRLSDIALGLFLLAHPIPVLFHLLAVLLFALLAGWPHINWLTLLLLVAAHGAMQVSIAILNDYCDRNLDALRKKEKPIPRGLIRPVEALYAGLLAMVVMVLLLLPLHPLALLVSLLYLACGQGYNLGLKSTPLSGIVFALAIPLIPVYAFVGMGRILPFLFWTLPIAALIGIALNLANSLPDIDEDAAAHARTLAVVLGARRTALVCTLTLLAGALLMLLLALTSIVPAYPLVLTPTLILGGLIACALWFIPQRTGQERKRYFYLVTIDCLLLAGGWLLAVLL